MIAPGAARMIGQAWSRRDDDGKLRTAKGDTVRAIVPVHLFGLCCDMNRITEIAGRFQLSIIEDAAQALGAEYRVQDQIAKAGTIGESGTFSFYPSKNLGAAGDAGMIVCREEAFARRLRHCRQHGMEPRYHHHFIGGNFRLDSLQAAIVLAKLPHLDNWTATRQRHAKMYDQLFGEAGLATWKESPQVGLPRVVTERHIFNQYVIRVSRRDKLQEFLRQKGIGKQGNRRDQRVELVIRNFRAA